MEEANINLEFLNDFGEGLTSKLNIAEVYLIIEQYLSTIVNLDIIGFGLLHEQKQEIKFSFYSERSVQHPEFSVSLDDPSSFSAYCYKNKEIIVCNNLDNEYSKYIKSYNQKSNKKPQSLLYYPLSFREKIIGILTLQSYIANAFSDQTISLIQSLLSYIAMAIDNALTYDIVKRQKDEINLILLDIKIPHLNGFEVLEEIRKINQKVVVIAQTAYALANEERRIRKAGFNDYLSKPIMVNNLFRVLSRYL